MTTDPQIPEQSAHGDQNVERLLGHAYQPELPDADFVQRVEERLLATAQQLAEIRSAVPADETLRLRQVRRRLGWVLGTAAALTIIALGWHAYRMGPTVQRVARVPRSLDRNYRYRGPDGLTARSRPSLPTPERLAAGAALQTRDGERRRVLLPDGTVLYVNQKTSLKVDAERRITLSSGEVYAEVAPRSEPDGTPFVIKTAARDVAALGTRLDVRAEPAGTGVAVTQGQVKVSGVDGLLRAGQQVRPGAASLTPAPRASYLLDWARELMAAAEAPLVPESKYAGGALIGTNQAGQESRLTLRKYHLDVHIEDGFARTTIDQTYFNEQNWRIEGTFYFPLPPDASLSRLAMYVDGTLMEGGMAERDHARNVYEQILYTRRDPALLEWVDGSTFKMRVFPLEGRQEKRIVLAYTQKLETLYGQARYRFPAGHNMQLVRDWSFHARVKDGAELTWQSATHTLQARKEGTDLVLDV